MRDLKLNRPIVPVVLSGGGGTRLWPMSRPEKPKQFLALTSEQTMFQMTVLRVLDRERFAPPVIVANAAHAEMVEQQLAEIGVADATILLEPCARNTAPAIALAALVSEGDAPLLVMPSDHVIANVGAFHAATTALLPLVSEGWLATYGISPTGPETGYGYIKMGAMLSEGVNRVERFVEKPDLAHATSMLADGDHVWNGGIFLFRAQDFLAALAAHEPVMLAAAQRSIDDAQRDGMRLHPDADAFASSPAESIDYAVMEKADRVAVAPVTMGWSDVGSWDALYEIGAHGDGSNALSIDTQNSLIRSDGVQIHAVGVSDLIVIASGNDVLIVPRSKSQQVKKIVEALKESQ